MTNTKRKLWYSKAWLPKFGSEPLRLIEEYDEGGYEWSAGVFYQLKSKQFAIVYGDGCSCTSFGDADDTVLLFQNETEARIEWVRLKGNA